MAKKEKCGNCKFYEKLDSVCNHSMQLENGIYCKPVCKDCPACLWYREK